MRVRSLIPPAVFLLAAVSLHGASTHPVERRLRSEFPSVPVAGSATFKGQQETIGSNVIAGLRAQFAAVPEVAGSEPLPHVTYPHIFNDALVAVFGEQRVVLRPVNARGAVAEESYGKLIYQQPFPSVDAIELPVPGRSEELLLLQDERAPLVYDFEIVAMRGVSGVVMDGNAIRFLPLSDAPSTSDLGAGRFTQVRRMLRIDPPWVIDATGRRSLTNAKWTLIKDGTVPRTIRLTVDVHGLSYPLVVDPSFSATGSLSSQRAEHTATLLQNGRILFAGGVGSGGNLFTYEVYDPATGTVTASGNMVDFRVSHSATLLRNGKVLLCGGWNGSQSTATAELFDPSNGSMTPTGNMVTARRFHTATLLATGKVLITGGTGNAIGAASILQSAELYDPSGAGTFASTGNMGVQRAGASATLLPSGKVLIAAGSNFGGYLNSAEVFDPAGAGTFSPTTGNLGTARNNHTATLLATGKVLIAGGLTASSVYPTACELFDPAAGTFVSTGPLSTGRELHTATMLPNGKVLLVGGQDSNSTWTATAEIYDPGIGTFSSAGTLGTARDYHSAVLLPGGQVQIAGGFNGAVLSSIEMYDWTAGSFSAAGALNGARQYPKASLLPSGIVLVAGGYNGSGSGYLAIADVFNPATNVFTPTGSLNVARALHTLTLLNTGKVLVAGGSPSAAGTSAELYDPTTALFTATGSLGVSRNAHSATLLPNGTVLIAGGNGTGGARQSAELFDPALGAFSATGNMNGARYFHTATLLATGKVLIVGGYNGAALQSAELYDPGSGVFTATGNLNAARYDHTATLLPGGKVLIAGGLGVAAMASAEVYDPSSGTFSTVGNLGTARYSHTATLLQTGKVLIAGGQGVSSPPPTAVELYDPMTGQFTATGSLTGNRVDAVSMLLTNGKALVAGGYNGSALGTAEVYDAGLGVVTSRAPVVSSSTTTLAQPGALSFTGTAFLGDSEASGGSLNQSATNYPIAQLRRVDNDQTIYVLASSFTSTGFSSVTLSALASGYYRATIFTNSLPSLERIILITGGAVPGTPTTFIAAAASTTTVNLSWHISSNAAGYEVYRTTSISVPYVLALSTTATSATDSGLAPDTTYLYKVQAVNSAGPSAFSSMDIATTTVFTDANLSGATVKAVHFTQLRTAVNAVRVAANLTPFTFTDTLTPGVTVILALHQTELRTKLDEARQALSLTPISSPVVTAGSTISAVNISDLRNGTQ